MTIKNNGSSPERLTHDEDRRQCGENDEVQSVEIDPGQTIEFKPGGSHVMFVGLKRQLAKGEHIKGSLALSARDRSRWSTALEASARRIWKGYTTNDD